MLGDWIESIFFIMCVATYINYDLFFVCDRVFSGSSIYFLEIGFNLISYLGVIILSELMISVIFTSSSFDCWLLWSTGNNWDGLIKSLCSSRCFWVLVLSIVTYEVHFNIPSIRQQLVNFLLLGWYYLFYLNTSLVLLIQFFNFWLVLPRISLLSFRTTFYILPIM